MVEHAPNRRVLLPKGAVFCRYGAKCDLATSTQFNRIIERRTALLKTELLRRIREVDVPAFAATPGSSSAAPTVLRVTTASRPGATPVRVTRNKQEATGIVVYEELDSALFQEINNVLAAGKLLSPEGEFIFDEKIYHRIYAERQHVVDPNEHERLAEVAIVKFYAPMLFWATKLPAAKIAGLLKLLPLNSKSPHMRILCRLAFLIGGKVFDWFATQLEKTWHNYAQLPEHLFLIRRLKVNQDGDRRLGAPQLGERASISIPGEDGTVTVRELLKQPRNSTTYLSRACMEVFKGRSEWRSAARQFDVIAYGPDLSACGASVAEVLENS